MNKKIETKEQLKAELKKDMDSFMSKAQGAVSTGVIGFDEYDNLGKSFKYAMNKISKISEDK